MEGIEKEVERIMDLWVKAGVTIFRVDNPHTKPGEHRTHRVTGDAVVSQVTVIVIVNLDGHNAHQSIVHVELGDFGFATDKPSSG